VALSGAASFSQHSPDTSDFAASVVPFTRFDNGKSPSLWAKGDRDLRLKHSNAAQ